MGDSNPDDDVEARHLDEVEALRRDVMERDRLLAAMAARAAASETMLNAVYRSLSWRLTGPLRGFALRHPRLARLWAWAHLPPVDAPTHPGPATVSPVTPGLAPLAVAGAAVSPPGAPGPSRVWFFMEDTIEWLHAHAQLSGVGRVTAALFFAGSCGPDGFGLVPCRVNERRLVSVSARDTAADLAARGVAHAPPSSSPSSSPPAPPSPLPASLPSSPCIGDVVLFTGMVWTPRDAALMQTLAEQGIGFGVFVHDLIAIDNPEFVTAAHAAMFADWLAVLVAQASVLFVPNPFVRGDILRWAARGGHAVSAAIVTARLGCDAPAEPPPDPPAALPSPCNAAQPFVLSVGTIDARKNQAMLCRTWVHLVRVLGDATPRLILVGREELAVAGLSPGIAALVASGVITVRDDVDDPTLRGLYRACLLTAFPSLAEGHGLPVAESLAHGKLCIASDLPVIRHHAGDLAWYHPPGDEAAATALLLRALQAPGARDAAEAAIAMRFRPHPWSTTLRTMIGALQNGVARWCTDQAPDVSIVLVTGGAAAGAPDCLRQIQTHTEGVRYEIVIVDNASGCDDLARLTTLAREMGRGVRLILLGTDRGLGEARNIGAEAARAPLLCLLDTSMRVQPGWLAQLVLALAANPAAAAAGPSDLALGAVDCLPGTALVLDREAFLAVGGFDLAFEPGGFEDDDLCRKLRASGRTLLACPASRVTPDAVVPGDPIAHARRDAVLDLNRAKLAAKWAVPAEGAPYPPARALPSAPTAALWTPYALTPGGGERFLLTLAAALATDHAVTIVTPHQYSRLRLMTLGRTFGVDVDACALATEAAFQNGPAPDLMITLGNEITPSVPARAANSLFICQFPFPVPIRDPDAARKVLAGYRAIIAYSGYARAHIAEALSALQPGAMPIEVVYPPVPAFVGDAAVKQPMILSVGRFIAGGHSKRHDAMIAAFKRLHDRIGTGTLHLVGSSYPAPDHLDHLDRLRQSAAGYPVEFHVNAPPARIAALYRDAMVYWHAAGLDADLVGNPGLAEHFGISVVEAMSAQATVIAFAAGGPAEIVSPGIDGFLFRSEAELVDLTERLMQPAARAERIAVGRAAQRRAGQFSTQAFIARARAVAILTAGDQARVTDNAVSRQS